VARATEAIENDFPGLTKVLGPAPLRSLTNRYTRRCPPRSYDLGRIGDRLARFLEGDALTKDLPFLPDLARLEWAVAEAFVSRDEAPLLWDDIARLGVEAAAELPLRLRPGAALVRSSGRSGTFGRVGRFRPPRSTSLRGRPAPFSSRGGGSTWSAAS
jgi:hypothetical protein